MRAGPSPIAAPTAIVHDWFQGYHGSERVVETLRAGLFSPDHGPDIYTFHAARELLPPALASAIVRESHLSRLPGIRQRGHHPGRWRYLLPYMPHYFARLDLRRYDLVISSSHACAVNVRARPGALHVCYCYTPMRYAWLPETEGGRVGGLSGRLLDLVAPRLRRMDLEASKRPTAYAAISEAVRERIRRFYDRDAVVIHPPVQTDDFRADREKEPGRFLWVGRLVAYKRPLEVAEAFRGLPYRLTMIGVGPLEPRLRDTMPPNVELLGWVEREELIGHFERSSGFIHVGEEDFGISIVEALAAGTPALVLDRGGARDIVRPDVDGVLVAAPDVESVRAGARAVAERTWEQRALCERAQAFSRERFLRRFAEFVEAAASDPSR